MDQTLFERSQEMAAAKHHQENVASAERLVNDGTWPGLLESYEKMDLDRLPAVDTKGYRLCYLITEEEKNKRVWFNVFFNAVMKSGGEKLTLQSTLGASLLQIADVQPTDTEEAVLERLKTIPVLVRVQKKPGTVAYPKPSNTVWAITHNK